MRDQKDYFVYNNCKYGAGTIVQLKMLDVYTKSFYYIEAVFRYVLDDNQYVLTANGELKVFGTDAFFNILTCVLTPVQYVNSAKQNKIPQKKKATFSEELNIDGLFIAWIWYIFIMLVGTIFFGRIIIWITASAIFFNYRKGKLKEAGYR